MRRLTTLVLALALSVSMTGCAGSQLVVRHDDPAYPRVEVTVDSAPLDTLDYGSSLYVRLDPGYHVVDVRPTGADSNPWSDDGRAWAVYVDGEVVLTLLQAPPAP